jgi:hypothetical protein
LTPAAGGPSVAATWAQGHLTLGGDAGDTLDDRLIIGSVQSVLEAYGAYKALRGGR